MPSFIIFLLKHWTWFAMAGLALTLAGFITLADKRGADLKVAKTQVVAATTRANEWKKTYDDAQALSIATAEAHGKERQQIIVMKDAAGAAKGEIAHAPGADDSFRYSDPAYRLLRARPGEPSGAPAEADPGLGGR